MKLSDLRALLKNKGVQEEIEEYLRAESQKVGYNIGIDRAREEWLRLNAESWMTRKKSKNNVLKVKSKRVFKKARKKPAKKSVNRK